MVEIRLSLQHTTKKKFSQNETEIFHFYVRNAKSSKSYPSGEHTVPSFHTGVANSNLQGLPSIFFVSLGFFCVSSMRQVDGVTPEPSVLYFFHSGNSPLVQSVTHRIWFILENVVCVLEKNMYSLAVGWNVLCLSGPFDLKHSSSSVFS